MRVLLVAAFVAVAVATSSLTNHHQQFVDARVPYTATKESFTSWMQAHNKLYGTPEVLAERFEIWKDNLAYVLSYNAKVTTHWLGMNSLADLTHEEYKKTYLGLKLNTKAHARAPTPFRYANAEVPAAVDWRTKGAVTPVKNQGQCGSCWSFSTTGSVEGINAIVTGKLQSGSEQELVDCDKASGDQGCNGGLMDNAFGFIKSNGGLTLESTYPYTAADGTCKKDLLSHHELTIDGFEDVPKDDESALQKAVAHQPVSVAIEADQRSFQMYSGGVLTATDCGEQLDHGVLAVGYGTDAASGLDFWIVKNSWGASWGEQGYIRLERNFKSPSHAGMCGIASAASYPTLGPQPPASPSSPISPPGAPPVDPTPVGPTKCSESASCPSGQTCCCKRTIIGICVEHACCPLPAAVCCKNEDYCCPADHPVCNVAKKTCDASNGLSSVAISVKEPAIKINLRVNKNE